MGKDYNFAPFHENQFVKYFEKKTFRSNFYFDQIYFCFGMKKCCTILIYNDYVIEETFPLKSYTIDVDIFTKNLTFCIAREKISSNVCQGSAILYNCFWFDVINYLILRLSFDNVRGTLYSKKYKWANTLRLSCCSRQH